MPTAPDSPTINDFRRVVMRGQLATLSLQSALLQEYAVRVNIDLSDTIQKISDAMEDVNKIIDKSSDP